VLRLAQRFQVPAEQLTPSIATLQEKGLVTLTAAVDVQGEGQLQLTSAGQETLTSLTTALHDNLSALLDGWSPEQETERVTQHSCLIGELSEQREEDTARKHMPEQFTHRAVCELRTRGQVIKDPFVGQVVHVQIRCGHFLRMI
jgi:hypothetical protein